jgi:hypothetical protein
MIIFHMNLFNMIKAPSFVSLSASSTSDDIVTRWEINQTNMAQCID